VLPVDILLIDDDIKAIQLSGNAREDGPEQSKTSETSSPLCVCSVGCVPTAGSF
jgi:hypothetical protein